MKKVIAQVLAQMPSHAVAVVEVDVSTDTTLERTYGHEIPVLLIDGRKSAKYRITEAELRKKLSKTVASDE